jgi:predicted ATPase/DNA-binding SARP family transcriptional activator
VPAQVPDGVTATYSQQYRRCGKPSCPLCAAGGRGHGPYWYAYWREEGRTRTRYLGKQPPLEVAVPQPPPTAQHEPSAAAPVIPPGRSGLRVRTLGGFALWRDNQQIAVERWERQQIGALLKWLLGAPGQRLTRDEVSERFWSESDPQRGRANLRVLVHRLRRVLGDQAGGASVVQVEGEVLTLRQGSAAAEWLDAEGFVRAGRAALAGQDAAACRAALARYTGDYLPDDAYAEWAVERREQLRQLRHALLLHLAALCAASGAREEAEGSLRAVLADDRCQEEAALALMRLCAATGRRGQALRVYRRLAEALREDLGLAPEAATQALARSLAGQQAAAPAPAVPDGAPHNLPAALTSFVGRQRELAALRAVLVPMPGAADTLPCRLLTLTGPGGAGKTRLALRLADELLDEPGAYPDGVWLVELASLRDPALLPDRVAQVLAIEEQGARPLADTLAAQLKTRRLLLILDNCEHLLDASAELAAHLLIQCPALRMLATSREALGVAGEQPWPIPALSLPQATTAGPIGHLLESEAARLFLVRARVQRPSLSVTETNAGAVARICRHLEGIPLALELAAARVGALDLDQIAARLSESFGLLSGGPRTAPRRQRTLRATLDWSYDLLDEPERLLLRRLAVFAGGCTLEAAEAVCAGEEIPTQEVLDRIGGLLRKSLLVLDEQAGEIRYRLLETVRQYAQEHLAGSIEEVAVRTRHLHWCLTLAEAAEGALRGPEQQVWLVRLEQEHDNLRAALRLARERGEQHVGLRIAGALWRFWDVRGHGSEGRRWLEELLVCAGARGPSAGEAAIRAKALNGAGNLAYMQDDYARARALHEESLALRRELGDMRGIAISLNNLGNVAEVQGDYTRARALLEESLALDRQLGDIWGLAGSLSNLGRVAQVQGDYAWARTLQEESLALRRDLGDRRGIAYSLINLGRVVQLQGDYAQARALQEQSLALFRELDDRRNIAYSLSSLGNVACDQGDCARATRLHEESLTMHRELGDKEGIATNLEGMARAATAPCAAPEILARASRLFSAAAALREAIGTPLPPSARAGYERATAAVRAAAGEAAWSAAWADGQTLTLEQTIDLALAGCSVVTALE